MTVFDIQIDALNGGPADLARYRGKALLVVNVASRAASPRSTPASRRSPTPTPTGA